MMALNMLADTDSRCKKKKTVTFKKPTVNKYHMELMVNGEIYRVVSRLSDADIEKAKKSVKLSGPWVNSVQLSMTINGVSMSRTTVISEAESKQFSINMSKNRRWTKVFSK